MAGFPFDSNVGVALTFGSHPLHHRGGRQLRQASPERPVCRIRATELSALRLITTPTIHRAFGVPRFSNAEAIEHLGSLFHRTGCVEVAEADGTRELWLRLADAGSPSPKLWIDAYLAAVSIQGALHFVTCDPDFQRYGSRGLALTLLE